MFQEPRSPCGGLRPIPDGAQPYEAFSSLAAGPCHHGLCPLAVGPRPVWPSSAFPRESALPRGSLNLRAWSHQRVRCVRLCVSAEPQLDAPLGFGPFSDASSPSGGPRGACAPLPSRDPPKGALLRRRQRDFPFSGRAPKSLASEPRWGRRIRPPRRDGSVEPGKAPPVGPSEEGCLGGAGRTRPARRRPEGWWRVGRPRRSLPPKGSGSRGPPACIARGLGPRAVALAGLRPSGEGRASVRTVILPPFPTMAPKRRAGRPSWSAEAQPRGVATAGLRAPKRESSGGAPWVRAANRAVSGGVFLVAERARATAPRGGR